MDEQNLNTESFEPEEDKFTVADGIVGVFISPKETFSSLRREPKKTYWLIPLLIVLIVGLVANFLRFRDEELMTKMRDTQIKKVQEQMDERVKSGTMTREQADAAIAQTEKYMNPKSTMFQVFGYLGVVIRILLFSFLLTSVFALIVLKIMKGEFTYTNILNVIAFALLIAALAELVNLILSIAMGDFKSVSLALILSPAAIGEKMYNFLLQIDIFTFWYTFALSAGLAAISKLKTLPLFLIFIVIFIGMSALFTFSF